MLLNFKRTNITALPYARAHPTNPKQQKNVFLFFFSIDWTYVITLNVFDRFFTHSFISAGARMDFIFSYRRKNDSPIRFLYLVFQSTLNSLGNFLFNGAAKRKERKQIFCCLFLFFLSALLWMCVCVLSKEK